MAENKGTKIKNNFREEIQNIWPLALFYNFFPQQSFEVLSF